MMIHDANLDIFISILNHVSNSFSFFLSLSLSQKKKKKTLSMCHVAHLCTIFILVSHTCKVCEMVCTTWGSITNPYKSAKSSWIFMKLCMINKEVSMMHKKNNCEPFVCLCSHNWHIIVCTIQQILVNSFHNLCRQCRNLLGEEI